MKTGRTGESGLEEHRRPMWISACRFVSMYRDGTSGRKASAAEMKMNGRGEVDDEGVESIVSSTCRANFKNLSRVFSEGQVFCQDQNLLGTLHVIPPRPDPDPDPSCPDDPPPSQITSGITLRAKSTTQNGPRSPSHSIQLTRIPIHPFIPPFSLPPRSQRIHSLPTPHKSPEQAPDIAFGDTPLIPSIFEQDAQGVYDGGRGSDE